MHNIIIKIAVEKQKQRRRWWGRWTMCLIDGDNSEEDELGGHGGEG